MVGMFGRRHRRSVTGDVSLVTEVINAMSSIRSEGLPVPVDQLPITVGAAQLHADMVAHMPFRTTSTDRRVLSLLEQPDPTEPRHQTQHKIVQSMFWTGNAYLLLDRPAPRTSSFRVLEPQAVQALWEPSDPLVITGWILDGNRRDAAEILAVKLSDDPRRGPLGETPLKRCAGPLSMYGWAYRYLIDYFGSGGNPSSVLKTAMELAPDRAEKLVAEWIKARRERRPAVMGPTVDLEIPPSSGELTAALSVLGHAAAEVSRMLNIPPSLVNARSEGYSLTYANVGDEFRRWLAVSLRPTWMTRIERAYETLTGLHPDDIQLDPEPMLELFAAADPDRAAAGDNLALPRQIGSVA